jgi:hypothetical protein
MEMVGKKNPHATIRVQDLMDIVQELTACMIKKRITIGDENSMGDMRS